MQVGCSPNARNEILQGEVGNTGGLEGREAEGDVCDGVGQKILSSVQAQNQRLAPDCLGPDCTGVAFSAGACAAQLLARAMVSLGSGWKHPPQCQV